MSVEEAKEATPPPIVEHSADILCQPIAYKDKEDDVAEEGSDRSDAGDEEKRSACGKCPEENRRGGYCECGGEEEPADEGAEKVERRGGIENFFKNS